MEISSEQLKKLFELSGQKLAAEDIEHLDISRALIEIERKLNYFGSGTSHEISSDLNILIVDDLELSIYQFSHILKRLGITPSIARNKEEAVAEIKKNKFDYLIIDLFLPDLKDGLDLIQEAISLRKTNDFKLIVISSTDDNKVIEKCYELGIDEFISKAANWHEGVLKYINSTTQNENTDIFSKYTANENITVYSIYKLNTPKAIETITKEVNSMIYSGSANIIFNLDKVKFFDPEFIYVFTDVYKACAGNGGAFVILNSSEEVNSALENAFLDGVIPITETVEEAIYKIETKN